MESRKFIINNSPVTGINLDKSSPESTFKIVKETVPELKDNQLLLKPLYFSNDASQRAWIQKGIPAEAMYVPPIRQGEPMRSFGLAEVVKSKSSEYESGELVFSTLNWADYSIMPVEAVFNKVPKGPLPLTAYLDYLGVTGLTAYVGFFNVVPLKKEDVVVISGAAGATGSMCVQLAKNCIGSKRVVGIAGGKAKCDYVKSIGADDCIDYKDAANFSKNMKSALGEDGYCDVYFDGVGGSILDQMMLLTKKGGKIIACGSVAGYDDKEKLAVYNYGSITIRSLTVYGFLVLNYANEFPTAIQKILGWVQEGKIKVGDDGFSLNDLSKDPSDFEKIPDIWYTMFNGEKKPGKLLTQLNQPKL